jgi:hypothetical protein
MRTTFFDASGRQVDASVACDANGVIKHGFRMKTNLMMMDSESRDPFVPLTDEQKIADIDARNAILSNAWRNPSAVVHQQAVPVDQQAKILEQRDAERRKAGIKAA